MATRREPGLTLRMLALALPVMAVLGATPAGADQVIADDLIVEGSACVGLDCQNGQPFSFTTVGLKEHNLRIFFDDTSVGAQFPRRDWEIIANDAINGGASFLGFADRGAGVVDVSGQGFCDGGSRDGLVCLDGIGGHDCLGVCQGGLFDGQPCQPDPSFCSDEGGTCVGAGVCVPFGAIIFRIEAGGPEDSLVIDSLGNVHVSGDLTVEGDVGNTEVQELREEVEALRAELEAVMSFPALRAFLDRN